jgi:hypothetical protein
MANLLVVGTAAGIGTITADITWLANNVPAVVTLTADYTLGNTPGYPQRPSFTGGGGANLDYPGRVIPNGTTLRVLQNEATALVNAGAAVLVSAGS